MQTEKYVRMRSRGDSEKLLSLINPRTLTDEIRNRDQLSAFYISCM